MAIDTGKGRSAHSPKQSAWLARLPISILTSFLTFLVVFPFSLPVPWLLRRSPALRIAFLP
jgi:ABC-type sulfate transport system permease component